MKITSKRLTTGLLGLILATSASMTPANQGKPALLTPEGLLKEMPLLTAKIRELQKQSQVKNEATDPLKLAEDLYMTRNKQPFSMIYDEDIVATNVEPLLKANLKANFDKITAGNLKAYRTWEESRLAALNKTIKEQDAIPRVIKFTERSVENKGETQVVKLKIHNVAPLPASFDKKQFETFYEPAKVHGLISEVEIFKDTDGKFRILRISETKLPNFSFRSAPKTTSTGSLAKEREEEPYAINAFTGISPFWLN